MRKKIYLGSIIFIIIDFISKLCVINFFDDKITVIDNFFFINKVTNTGAAFSIFSGYVLIFIIIALFVLFCLDKYFISSVNNKFDSYIYMMLVGGIVGNLIDRIVYGEVVDFLSFNIFGYMFPIFNFADVFICISVFLIIFRLLKERDE